MERSVVNGTTLAYEVAGQGEPVILIHGSFIADAFRPLFAEPSLAGLHRLIAYRRRGYGGSDLATGWLSIADQAHDCRALLRYLDVQRAHVVGHSFGGVVAIQLALEEPEVVHSLALLEPALMVGGSAWAYRESLALGMQHYRAADATVVVDKMLEARWPGYRASLQRVLPGAFDAAVAAAPATFETDHPALLDWNFGEEEARRITKPVLSVLGSESDALSPRFGEAHRWMLAHLLKVEGYVLPRAHHFLQMENSGDMAEALAAFYARNPLRS
jgi:pimeloyl-ACP methyl ester carboxylesterase